MGCDIAWCAGFLDGEGSFVISQRSLAASQRHYTPRFRAFIIADQVVEEPLLKLKACLGGSIHLRKHRTVTGKPIWHWSLAGARMVEVACAKLLPYLTVKRERAKLLLEFVTFIAKPGMRLTAARLAGQREVFARFKEI